MSQRLFKIITKGLFIWPFTTLFSLLLTDTGIDDTNFLIGFVLACSYLFLNIYEYNKHDEIHIEDYLESRHKVKINNGANSWDSLYHILTHQIAPNTRIIIKTDSIIHFSIKRYLVRTTLIAEKRDMSIELSIKNQSIFAFLPDHAKNYQSLKKLQLAMDS